MSCPNPVLDEDGERVCECGDEGRSCEQCAAEASAYWYAAFRAAPLSERDPAAYRQALIDSGRDQSLQAEEYESRRDDDTYWEASRVVDERF
jgi:hypothetical protein